MTRSQARLVSEGTHDLNRPATSGELIFVAAVVSAAAAYNLISGRTFTNGSDTRDSRPGRYWAQTTLLIALALAFAGGAIVYRVHFSN